MEQVHVYLFNVFGPIKLLVTLSIGVDFSSKELFVGMILLF